VNTAHSDDYGAPEPLKIERRVSVRLRSNDTLRDSMGKMGSSVKSAKVVDDGVSVNTDLSNMTLK
jgi:hypothetical protein